jgi:hypothetical protein
MNEIERVKQGIDAAEWNVAEAVMLRCVDELVETHGLKPSSHAALRAHYSVPQIMDIIAIHGMYVILGCMINTWGLELDADVKDRLPECITREGFEAGYAQD